MAEKFHFLKYGLAFVLTFIGVKMILPLLAEGVILGLGNGNESGLAHFLHSFVKGDYNQTVTFVSLGIVAGALILSIVLSLMFPPTEEPAEMSEIE
jgi:predicted tellurium resistance membrane protein TerC